MIEHINTTNPISPFRLGPEPSRFGTFTPAVRSPLESELGIGLNVIVLLPITTAVAEIPKLRTVPLMMIGGPPGVSVPPAGVELGSVMNCKGAVIVLEPPKPGADVNTMGWTVTELAGFKAVVGATVSGAGAGAAIELSPLRPEAGFNAPARSNVTGVCEGADETGMEDGTLLGGRGPATRLKPPQPEAEIKATAGAAFATVVRVRDGSFMGGTVGTTRLEPPSPEAGGKATAGDTCVTVFSMKGGLSTGERGAAARLEPPSPGGEGRATAVGMGADSSKGVEGAATGL